METFPKDSLWAPEGKKGENGGKMKEILKKVDKKHFNKREKLGLLARECNCKCSHSTYIYVLNG